jgi:hypothetical protein
MAIRFVLFNEPIIYLFIDYLHYNNDSDDGRFVGLGTLEGSVDVYIAFSLQRVYHISQAHNIFVTGVEFLKSSVETQQLTGGNDAALVSVSVDNHIVLHQIPKRGINQINYFFFLNPI